MKDMVKRDMTPPCADEEPVSSQRREGCSVHFENVRFSGDLKGKGSVEVADGVAFLTRRGSSRLSIVLGIVLVEVLWITVLTLVPFVGEETGYLLRNGLGIRNGNLQDLVGLPAPGVLFWFLFWPRRWRRLPIGLDEFLLSGPDRGTLVLQRRDTRRRWRFPLDVHETDRIELHLADSDEATRCGALLAECGAGRSPAPTGAQN